MKENPKVFKNSSTSIAVFIISIFTSGFWFLIQIINPYDLPLKGMIYELLWLPALGLLFFLPLISLKLMLNEKFTYKSLYIYTIAICVATILIMFLK